MFTKVGTPELPAYEYRLLVSNDSTEPIFPKLTLLLFDEAGIQVGLADIGSSEDWQQLKNKGLEPGERGSFSGSFNLLVDAAPVYFLAMSDPLDAPPRDK